MLNQDLFQSSLPKQFIKVIVKSGLWILPIAILSTIADQKLTETLDGMIRSPAGLDSQIWIFGFLSILNSVLAPALTGVLVLSSFSNHGPLNFLRQHLGFYFKESLRVYGQSLLWSYALILPGALRFLRCSFVPFIVCLDPRYGRGEIDALENSRKISKGLLLPITGLFLLSSVLPQVILALGDDNRLILSHPLPALGLLVLQMLVEILFVLLMLKLFRRKVQI